MTTAADIFAPFITSLRTFIALLSSTSFVAGKLVLQVSHLHCTLDRLPTQNF